MYIVYVVYIYNINIYIYNICQIAYICIYKKCKSVFDLY